MPDSDKPDENDKPAVPISPGDEKKTNVGDQGSPLLPTSASFGEGQPLSSPFVDECITEGQSINCAPPVTPCMDRSASWTVTPTPPLPSQETQMSDSSRLVREPLPPVPPPRAVHSALSPTEQDVVVDDGERETHDTTWCRLIPVKCAPSITPIAICTPSFSFSFSKKQVLQKALRDKTMLKITTTSVPIGGSNVYMEPHTASADITINDVAVARNEKHPLVNGDELSFRCAGVINIFTVLFNQSALTLLLSSLKSKEKRKAMSKERATPPPPPLSEDKLRRKVLSEPSLPPVSVGTCATCNTMLLTWFKVCPGCAAPVPMSPPKQKNSQCLMCQKYTGGAALCHICNYNSAPAPSAQPQPLTQESAASQVSEEADDKPAVVREQSLQKIQALKQLLAERSGSVAPPKKKRKTGKAPENVDAQAETRIDQQTSNVNPPQPQQEKQTTLVEDEFVITDEIKKTISLAAADLSAQVIAPENNPVVFDETFPYYLEPTEREQIHHALFLNLAENQKIRCLDNVSKTLGLIVESEGCDLMCEMVMKGMAKNLGSFFLAFDPSMLEATDGTPTPLQVLGLHVSQPVRAGGKAKMELSGATLPAPFVSGTQHVYEVGDKAIYYPASKEKGQQGVGIKGRVLVTFPKNQSSKRVGVCFDTPQPSGTNLGGACPAGKGLFVDPAELRPDTSDKCLIALHALFRVMESYQPLIVCVRDIPSKYILSKYSNSTSLKNLLSSLRSKACIGMQLATQAPDRKRQSKDVPYTTRATEERDTKSSKKQQAQTNSQPSRNVSIVAKLLPNVLHLSSKPDAKASKLYSSSTLSMWKNRLDSDKIYLRLRTNVLLINQLLGENSLHCKAISDLRVTFNEQEPYQLSAFDSLGPAVKMLTLNPERAQQVVSWAVAHHLQKNNTLQFTQSERHRLILNVDDLAHGISLCGKNTKKKSEKKGNFEGIEMDNEYEAKLLNDVIPAGSVHVSFDDIGALHKVKDVLKEVVLQPLQRPGLFSRSKLTVPSKGVLLFGPPGTGKTMVAKAIATSVRASFLCVGASSVTSKWVGEGEKFAAAVFGLAAKIAPCIIFIDEIDALLSKRGDRYEHESSRKIKNEIMSSWDGMHSHEHVMVIGATNRPQDLDEAVLRRLSRRLLVDLPDKQCRVEILKVLLKDEKVAPGVSFEDVASQTPGFTGSDLRNLCITAAYRPIKRYLKESPLDTTMDEDPFVEREMRMLQERDDALVELEHITMQDFEAALKIVTATVHEDATSVEELRRWNEMYGEEGSRRAKDLPYFM